MTIKDNSELEEIVQGIQDKKGFNILVLDVQEISSLTYYFVLAEGRVERHLKAISDEVLERMAKLGHKPLMIEGEDGGDWLVIDFGDIMVHLFKPSVREKYGLEEVWRDSKLVDCGIDEKANADNSADFNDF